MLTHAFNLIFLFSLLFTVSCASIFSGTTETIYVRSDVPGTTFYLDKANIGTDNGKVKISKKRLKKVRLHAKKEGCQTTTTEIATRFDTTSLFGLLIDLGVVSILIIDWGTYGAVRQAVKVNYVLSPVCDAPQA